MNTDKNEGRPMLAIQDGQNIDETRIGQDLATITEKRSVKSSTFKVQSSKTFQAPPSK